MEVYGRLAQAVRPAREYAAAFFRWLLLGAVVGAAGGAVLIAELLYRRGYLG